jgi:integrase/recombinase XerD
VSAFQKNRALSELLAPEQYNLQPKPWDVGIDDVWIEYRRDCRARGHSPKTLEAYERAVGALKRACALHIVPEDFHAITRAHMNRFREELIDGRLNVQGPPAPSTAHQVLRSLKTFFRWAVQWEFIEVDPTAGLRNVKIPDRLLPTIDNDDILRLLEQLDLENDHLAARNRAILLVLLDGGPRASELVGLQLEDLDLEEGAIMVRQGKGGVDRLIPLSSECLLAISAYVRKYRARVEGPLFLSEEGNPMQATALNQMLRRLTARAGVAGTASPHMWRRTFITRLAETEAPIQHIQTLAGHKQVTTTMRYCAGRDVAQAFRTHRKHSPVKLLYERMEKRLDGRQS